MQMVTLYRVQNRNQLLFYSGDELQIVTFGACELLLFFFFKGTNPEGKQRMICDWLSSTCEIGKKYSTFFCFTQIF